MRLIHLKYFKMVAEVGSMSAAAQRLGISQPAVTAAMRRLEEHFETTLLLRNPRGVQLTDTGVEVLRYAEETLALLEQVHQRVLGLESAEVGSFIIGCYESLGAYFLPQFLPQFLARYPRIELTLWNGSSPEVRDAVVARKVHFGLVVNPVPHPDLVLVDLFSDAVDFIVPTEQRAHSLDEAFDRVRQGPLVFAGRIDQSRLLLDALIARDAVPQRLLSCGDLEMVKSLVMAGLGVAILPRRVAAYGHDGVISRLHPEMPFIPDSIKLVYRADVHRTQAALLVKDALVDSGHQLEALGTR
ncbi:MAG: LysR family transcriptional regulator [Myxococcota bacterium]